MRTNTHTHTHTLESLELISGEGPFIAGLLLHLAARFLVLGLILVIKGLYKVSNWTQLGTRHGRPIRMMAVGPNLNLQACYLDSQPVAPT